MADLEEVSAALASTITGIINTNGAPVPIAVISGWPSPNDLQKATNEGKVLISVFALAGSTSNTTRHQWDWDLVSSPVLTLTASILGSDITFSGTVTPPMNIAVTASHEVYVASVGVGATPTSVAAALAALISVDQPATSVGPVLTIPSVPPDMKVAIGGQGTIIRENARSRQAFQITVWAQDQPKRISAVKSFAAGLLALNYIDLPDGKVGMLSYQRDFNTDAGQVDNFYRRDFIVNVEYGITETESVYNIVTTHADVIPVLGVPIFVPPKVQLN